MTIQIYLWPDTSSAFRVIDGVEHQQWKTDFDLDGETVEHVIETLTAVQAELVQAVFEHDSDYRYPHVFGWKPVTEEERQHRARAKDRAEAERKAAELRQLEILKAKYPDA